ncbi:MAG: hypothetical protein QW630_04575 [Sulfolobales archaeon]
MPVSTTSLRRGKPRRAAEKATAVAALALGPPTIGESALIEARK